MGYALEGERRKGDPFGDRARRRPMPSVRRREPGPRAILLALLGSAARAGVPPLREAGDPGGGQVL